MQLQPFDPFALPAAGQVTLSTPLTEKMIIYNMIFVLFYFVANEIGLNTSAWRCHFGSKNERNDEKAVLLQGCRARKESLNASFFYSDVLFINQKNHTDVCSLIVHLHLNRYLYSLILPHP